ncbi:DUF433 domain-containing protein [Candidatus Fermentibacteria bacterium]|nr:DUF433 domain-containing protein [Candidatus Fermentibacteria bacterium]
MVMAEMATIPIETDAQGVARVGGTRVTLESIVEAFRAGATAEEIVQQYPSVTLADVYQVVGYCLHRPEDIEAYLAERGRQRERVRDENERRFDPQGIRDRLLSRARA